ncbi:sulfotransferase family protein [Streptomyces albireticuli]|uniref:sulfotransferase family protein n=1 Tax=Streptomyces albireticuli TaxID=1940 RepID=UPI003695B54A
MSDQRRESAPGTFVICSGRCGSTLIADLLAEHPDMTPLLEFFGSQYQAGMAQKPMTGQEFWELLTAPWISMNTALRIGRVPKEVRYDVTGLDPETELSGLLGFTLPALSEDPDRLLEELSQVVPGWETQPLGAHYQRFFTLLTRHAGRPRWVEKSATSGVFVHDLLEMFPDARFVYLTRDVVDVSVSMTGHPMFLMADLSIAFQQRCGVDPYQAGGVPEGFEAPADMDHLMPGNLSPFVLDYRSGSVESLMNLTGLQAMMAKYTDDALSGLPAGRVHRMVYEDLLADPRGELDALGRFLELDDAGEWARRSATRVATPRAKDLQVDEAGRAQLKALYDEVYATTEVTR